MSQTTPQSDKTDRIVEQATRHFAEHGFEATKLSEVARDAGVAVGTIYLRYKSKNELLIAVMEAVETRFDTALQSKHLWEIEWPERFGHVMQAMFNQAAKEQNLVELMALVPFALRDGYRSGTRLRQSIAAHIADGQQRGQLRNDVDPAIAASLAHGMVEGAMSELMANPQADPTEMIEELTVAATRWLAVS
ncbi:TetR/AcrR family transcriptional regulator [Pseudahrensia aquimaris]|uniref:TetR/AcrR family transcriptional regulator n=1 Tax=Pseudahrensia aquimaris TaxID=744461 RepID=A0ABW3FBG6_9HYPH